MKGRWGIAGFIAVVATAAGLSGSLADEPAEDEPNDPGLVRDPAVVWALLSQPIPDVRVLKEHVPIASFDGKTMDTWIYRPDLPADQKIPAIINFSPYWGNHAPQAEYGGDNFAKYLVDFFLPRGYGIVLTSVRGTGQSEGCFDLGGEIERRDAAAVIEAVAHLPWSNGSVGAGGKSYDGTTPNGVALDQPAALKAIVPVSGISEFYKYTYKGGLPYGELHGATFNSRYVADVGWGEYIFEPTPPQNDSFKPDDVCPEFVEQSALGLGTAAVGDYTEYWQERDYAASAGTARAALFLIHGLQDWNVKPDHILPWLKNYGGPKKVWLHQWVQPEDKGGEGGHVYPFREDWNYTMLRFFDHTLKGIDTGLFDEPAVQVEDSTGTWRHEDAWPPIRVDWLDLYLASDASGGKIQPNPGPANAARSFIDDGKGPNPSSSSSPNQLLYWSEPLAADHHIVGAPRVHLEASTDKTVGKVAYDLYDVDLEGERTLINWGGVNLRHRVDPRDPQPVVPNENYVFVGETFPQDTLVPAGHRLLLAFAGNAGQGSYIGFEELAYQSKITIKEGGQTALQLPLLARETIVPESPQPVEASYCWAC